VAMEKRLELKLDREIKKISQTIPYIHRGGCGVFSLLLWDTLAFMGILTKPIEMFDDYPRWLRNHILLTINGLYIDSNGVHDTTKWMGLRVERPLSLESLRNQAWDDTIWYTGVDSFNRDNILPMKNMIHKLGYAMQAEKKSMLIFVL